MKFSYPIRYKSFRWEFPWNTEGGLKKWFLDYYVTTNKTYKWERINIFGFIYIEMIWICEPKVALREWNKENKKLLLIFKNLIKNIDNDDKLV